MRFSATLSFVFALCASAPAFASVDKGPDGGPGGSYRRVECGPGQYLAGLHGRIGAWADGLTMLCGTWNNNHRALLDIHQGATFGTSSGGDDRPDAVCPPERAVSRIKFNTTAINLTTQGYVQNIKMSCQMLTTDTDDSVRPTLLSDDSEIMGTANARYEASYDLACDPGQVAVGVVVRSGVYVDALGLICGPKPTLSLIVDHDLYTKVVPTPVPTPDPKTHRISGRDITRITTPSTTPAAFVAGSAVIEGDWNTSEGAMSFEQDGNKLTGSYSTDSGRISAKRRSGAWNGVWSEAKSQERCNTAKLGTYYWGAMTFVFSNQNRHFDGVWAYCKDDPSGGKSWSGDRVK